jgi:hypothetical protein
VDERGNALVIWRPEQDTQQAPMLFETDETKTLHTVQGFLDTPAVNTRPSGHRLL